MVKSPEVTGVRSPERILVYLDRCLIPKGGEEIIPTSSIHRVPGHATVVEHHMSTTLSNVDDTGNT